ncbi:hypothetical protein FSP39_003681 [Pinctada imbricata]|uniref:Uncharacterized protein n=1 Tax=Pinctada imbricata TaxID=66713 RepID=A0AA88XMD7_PINIB|nr:hypothetical protein FSP39_003681 [Pinctada imbricata]
MLSPVLLIWTLLSILVSALATYAFVQPAWFRTADGTRTFGMVSLCVTKTQGTIWQKCEFYGGYFNLGHLPSGYWQAACVLYGIGCVLLCCGAFLAVCTSCMTAEVVRSVTVMAGYVQFIAEEYPSLRCVAHSLLTSKVPGSNLGSAKGSYICWRVGGPPPSPMRFSPGTPVPS